MLTKQNVTVERNYNLWTQDELDYLKEYYDGSSQSLKLVSEHLGRTERSIIARANRSFKGKTTKKRSTLKKEELTLIRQLVESGLSHKEIVDRIRQFSSLNDWISPTYQAIIDCIQSCEKASISSDGYSIEELQTIFQVRVSTIQRWFKDKEYSKLLKPEGNIVEEDNLRRFIKKYPGEVARTQVDLLWLITLLL
jgi:hypothetical protein